MKTEIVRTELTPDDIASAKRLRAIWDRKKRALGLTQARAGELMGYAGQSAVSQYLLGTVRLNTDAVLKFSRMLGVEPGEIDPRVGALVEPPPASARYELLVDCAGLTPDQVADVQRAVELLRAGTLDPDGFRAAVERAAAKPAS